MFEQWLSCIGFEGFYEVSDYGNVRRQGAANNLAKVIDKDGYVIYCFCIKNKRTNVMAHQLVAEAFNGPRPIDKVTRHRDGKHQNNFPSNLKYGTCKENSEDMVEHGTQCKGSRSHLSRLREQDILNIRAANKTQAELANTFGISQSNVSSILNRITWKHI